MTTTDDLDAIEARVRAATKGPWEALTDPGDRKTAPAWIVDADEIEVRLPATFRAGKVAEFIAHARTDVPALLALLREQAATIERVATVGRSLQVNQPGDPGSAFDRGYATGRRAAGDIIVAALGIEAQG